MKPTRAYDYKRATSRCPSVRATAARLPVFVMAAFLCISPETVWGSTSPFSGDSEAFSSPLPLVIIDTLGQGVKLREKVPVWARVIGVTNHRSSTEGAADYNGPAGLSIRGSSSQIHPKKSYRLELQDGTGNDKKVSILGMPKESDWVLYAS